jgi:sensor histidine kinase YesM
MNFSERKLRIYGYLGINILYYFFFVVGMLFEVKDPSRAMIITFIMTLVQTLLLWEPTRYLVLRLRQRWTGSKKVRIRLLVAFAILLPYSVAIGVLRVYAEEWSGIYRFSILGFANFAAVTGLCIFLVLLQVVIYESIYLFMEWDKARREAEELKRINVQVQMDSLKVQIQPHFLFNTLNTLIGLIEVDGSRAIYFTEKLAYVYRYLLEANDRSLISLEEEVEFAKAYFYLIKTRYPQGLYLDFINVEEALAWQIPPLTLQILLENAVKHNVVTKKDPLYIRIAFDRQQERLQITNNLQRKTAEVSTGKGLLHIKKKFQLLNLPEIEIYSTVNDFSVKVPLVKHAAYESADH